MHAALEVLLTDGVIDEVVARLKSGKEADVYIVTHGGQYVAAKIYKERTQRNFKNNAGYKEGRLVRNSRTRRAMEKGSRFGQEAEEEAWKAAESETLSKLHTAGVRVPAPVMFYEGVLLMELLVDAEGQPAPRLVDALLTPELAAEFYRDLRQQAVKILCCDLIHGDLSAYNILLGANGPTIIDFPQTVSAAANSRAEFFFKRDLDNLRLFFAGYDPSLMGRAGDVTEIWRAYVRRELTPDFEPSGRGVPDARGPRQGGRPGGRVHGEGGRPSPPRERPHAPVQETREAAAPEVEDEFALLRQGGGERPKVAQLARNGRGGGDRSHRGGPGGPHRGGGHAGRPHGGGRQGPPHGGASHHGAGGQSRPNTVRAPHGGGGPGKQHGARAPHGGGGPGQQHGARAAHGGGGSGPQHGTRGHHGGGGSGSQHGARGHHGGGGQAAPHGRRGQNGGGGHGAPRGGHSPSAPGGGHTGHRQPRQGRRGAAPVVSYVSRGVAPEPGGSTEEP